EHRTPTVRTPNAERRTTNSVALSRTGLRDHMGGPHRQTPEAPSGRGEDRIGDRGCNWRDRHLSGAVRTEGTRYDMHLDGGRLVHAQDREVVVVALPRRSALERDLGLERSRESPHDPTFDLRLEAAEVDDASDVGDADNAMHAD